MAEAAEAFGLDQGGGGVPAPSARSPTPLAPSMAPPANTNESSPLALPPEADQLVKVIRTHEGTAKGDGNVLYGGKPFAPGSEHPADAGWQGGHGPDGSQTHAAGQGQWQPGTWHAEAERIKKLGVEPNFADEHQQNWAMWDLGSRTYQARTGRNLAEDIKSGKADYHALGSVWQGLQAGVGPHLVNGPLNQPAMTLVDQWKADLDRKDKQYDSALDEAKSLRAGARAMTEKWAAESDKPPQDMHQAWSQWGGVAGAIALIGGMFGRNHTAALNAAGEMMQAANSADQRAYDKSYQLWKDHLERGMKLVELLNKDASDIVNDAQKSYDHKIAELGVLSNAYSLQQQLDPNSVERLTKNAQLQKLQADIIKANNETTEVRLSASDKDAAWLKDHPEANGKIPPAIHNTNLGEAERERSGSGGKLAQQTAVATQLEAKYIADGAAPAEARARAYRETGIIPGGGGQTAKPGTEVGFTQDAIKSKEDELKRPLTAEERRDAQAQAHTDWAKASSAGKQAAGAGSFTDGDISYWANVLKNGGHFPPGLARGPGGSQFVVKVMQAMGRSGESPEDFIANVATVKADSSSLGNLTKMADAATSYERTASMNFDTALRLSKDAVPTDLGPFFNRWIMEGEKMLGDTNVPPYVAAMLTGANEYAKIMNGSTGSQGSTVDSRREAAELFSPYLSKGQIDRVVAVAKTDMENRKSSLYGQIDDVKNRLRSAGSHEPTAKQMDQKNGPAVDSVPAPPGVSGDPDGTSYRKDGKLWVKKGNQLILTPGAVETPR